MSNNVYRINVQECVSYQCPTMCIVSMSNNVYRVNVQQCVSYQCLTYIVLSRRCTFVNVMVLFHE